MDCKLNFFYKIWCLFYYEINLVVFSDNNLKKSKQELLYEINFLKRKTLLNLHTFVL